MPRPPLVIGDRVGPSRFDPCAGFLGAELVHVYRLPPAGVARLRAALAALGEVDPWPLWAPVVLDGDVVLSAVAPAAPLSLLVDSGPWLTTTAALALLADLAAAVMRLHAAGLGAGWIGPESVLVDARGRAGLDVALAHGHARPFHAREADPANLATLVGWVAHRRGLRLRRGPAALLDEAANASQARDTAEQWLSRARAIGAREDDERIPDLRNSADRHLLDVVSERERATALAAPDRPRRGLRQIPRSPSKAPSSRRLRTAVR